MTLAAVAADLGQALDVQRGLTAQVALNDEVVVDALTQLVLVLVGEVLDSRVGVDSGHLQNLQCAGSADAIDVSETNFDSLVLGQVNAGYTCHIVLSSFRIMDCAFPLTGNLFPPEGVSGQCAVFVIRTGFVFKPCHTVFSAALGGFRGGGPEGVVGVSLSQP
jgi:hypothetical protein